MRNITSVAPFLASDFVDLVEPTFNIEAYQEFIDKHRTALGTFQNYLISKLHDSRVIEVITTANEFTIVLNDIVTFDFAQAVINEKGLPIDIKLLTFPVSLRLFDNPAVKYYQVEDNGDMIEIEPVSLHEYLYEQVLRLEDNLIEIGFTFWQDRSHAGERFIVIVQANQIDVEEKQFFAWKQAFGEDLNGYYFYFKEQFDSDRYIYDCEVNKKLVEEYDLNSKHSF